MGITLSETERAFLAGLIVLCVISAVFHFVFLFLFNITISEADRKFLEQREAQSPDEPELNHKLAKRTIIFASISYIASFSFFINSAILMATLVKRFL